MLLLPRNEDMTQEGLLVLDKFCLVKKCVENNTAIGRNLLLSLTVD